MEILQRQMSFDSCTDDERIFARVFEPADKADVRAVLQIAHGMAEHSLLYVDFARALAAEGYSVAINDHLGHGKSVSAGGAYGYFGKGGCQNLVKDMHKLYGLMQKDYPDIPYVLMGHSMGSLLARSYAAQYGEELAAVIFMGTCSNPGTAVLSAQKRIANAIVEKKGEKSHDQIFAKLSTEKYNSAFKPFRTPNDWISRDEAQVDIYTNDPLCGFAPTASGFRDLVSLQAQVNSSGWFKKMPKIPIFLLSGERDPVGGFGKGVRQVAAKLRKTGHEVRLILYPEARHALLSEINKDEVYGEIKDFLSSVVITK